MHGAVTLPRLRVGALKGTSQHPPVFTSASTYVDSRRSTESGLSEHVSDTSCRREISTSRARNANALTRLTADLRHLANERCYVPHLDPAWEDRS